MNIPALITNNIAELLSKIIDFTRRREELIVQNIDNVRSPGFVPADLDTDEFSNVMNEALDEHALNGRIVLRDTENIKFGIAGNFQVEPVADEYARKLLEQNPDEYLELQTDKLLENSLNRRIATQLLKQEQKVLTILDQL